MAVATRPASEVPAISVTQEEKNPERYEDTERIIAEAEDAAFQEEAQQKEDK